MTEGTRRFACDVFRARRQRGELVAGGKAVEKVIVSDQRAYSPFFPVIKEARCRRVARSCIANDCDEVLKVWPCRDGFH